MSQAVYWAGGTLAAGTLGVASWLLYPRCFPASSGERLAAAELALLKSLREHHAGELEIEQRW